MIRNYWERWFAWHPVVIHASGRIVWLRTVERRQWPNAPGYKPWYEYRRAK